MGITVDLFVSILVKVAIAAIIALVTSYVVPWLKLKAENEKNTALAALYRTLVEAAEQIFKTPQSGEDKIKYVEQELVRRGYDVDIAWIEAAVREMKASEQNVSPANIKYPTCTK